jgi:hypothetical protein
MSKSAGKASGGSAAGAAAGTQSPQSAGLAAGAVSPSNPAPPTPSGVVAAMEASPGASQNHVDLADLRDRLGGTRAEQDAAIKKAWQDGKLTLNSSEGRFAQGQFGLTDRTKNAALYLSPSPDGFRGPDGRTYRERLVFASRR